MTGIRETTKNKMRDVLTMLINNSNQPQNKTGIIIKSNLPEKSYSHTMSALKGMNLITNTPENSRRWMATRNGMNWLQEQMFQSESQPESNNRFVNAGMVQFDPNISFVPTNNDYINEKFSDRAKQILNAGSIRLNLTDIMQFVNAIIGDRSDGDLSWTRDGREFTVEVKNGVVNLFVEA